MEVVSKYCSKPSGCCKENSSYLKGTADISLKYKKSENTNVVGYSDADYADDLDDRQFTYFF